MPIYEYECKACGDVREIMQKISDLPPASCPACAKGPLVKLMSRTAFILKGEGWYVTDFRDKGKTKPAAAGTASDTPTTAEASAAKEPKNTPVESKGSSEAPAKAKAPTKAATSGD